MLSSSLTMDSGQLPEPDSREPPDRSSSPVRPSSSDKSSTPSNFSPSPNLISPKELQSRTLPLFFFSILHFLSSPLSVLFTRIIPEGRSKPEIFQTSLYSVPEVLGLLFSLLFKQNELFPWIRRCLVLGLPVNLFLQYAVSSPVFYHF